MQSCIKNEYLQNGGACDHTPASVHLDKKEQELEKDKV